MDVYDVRALPPEKRLCKICSNGKIGPVRHGGKKCPRAADSSKAKRDWLASEQLPELVQERGIQQTKQFKSHQKKVGTPLNTGKGRTI
jgi:hypothetical protein